MSLFTKEERLQMMHDHQQRENAELVRKHAEMTRPKTKAEILVEVCREFPDTTVRELSENSAMSQSWVRRTLKAAGITLAKPVRGKKAGQA
jgi:hypothetical protein